MLYIKEFDVELEVEDFQGEDIKDPFDPSQIKVNSIVSTINSLLSRLENKEIDLAPGFQRSDDVWDDRARSRFIESLLVRIPIPTFYLDVSNEDKWIVVDGLQRLTTLKKFVIDGDLVLNELEYLDDLNGKKYTELHRKYQRRIHEAQVTTVVIEKGTPENVMYNIFKRINTGGVPLNSQEIRQALFHDVATGMLKKEAKNERFCEIMKPNNSRMEGAELMLRIFSYVVIPLEVAVEYSHEERLNKALEALNQKSEDELNELMNSFHGSLNLSFHIFEQYVFRKQYEENDRKRPLSKTLYETLMSNFCLLEPEVRAELFNKKAKFKERFFHYMNDDEDFYKSLGTGYSNSILYRHKIIRQILEEVI